MAPASGVAGGAAPASGVAGGAAGGAPPASGAAGGVGTSDKGISDIPRTSILPSADGPLGVGVVGGAGASEAGTLPVGAGAAEPSVPVGADAPSMIEDAASVEMV